MSQLEENPFYWNPNHWARRRTWSVPEHPDHDNAILERDDGREMLYDAETGVVSMADTYNRAARQMSRGEHLTTIEEGLSLSQARTKVRSIITRDIPEEERKRGRKEADAFLESVT
jgi:hypothetical protein